MLKVSDPGEYPGHIEWLVRDKLTEVIRGFSMLVSNGEVTAFFPRSRLNPASDARLEEAYVQQILRLLPTIPSVRMLE